MPSRNETDVSPNGSFHKISVIVPANPFIEREVSHCLAAIDVSKLMDWWPGKPHFPHRNAGKVKAIQRSLDWKRVAQIAAYLLQRGNRVGAPQKIERYFTDIYGQSAGELWKRMAAPRLPTVARFSKK